jgi:hypothetical protein
VHLLIKAVKNFFFRGCKTFCGFCRYYTQQNFFTEEQHFNIQSDQQESKSEQALQIIGHVVAESYANKRSKHGRRQFVVSNATL